MTKSSSKLAALVLLVSFVTACAENVDNRGDRQDCRQEEGVVGGDKRDCKQEERVADVVS